MDLYRRLRHTYGFGVHSPRAYRLVKDVLRPAKRLRWYGYEDIEAWLERWVDSPRDSSCGYRSQHDLRSDSRLLLRLGSFLEIHSVWLPPDVPSPIIAALKAADSRMRMYNERGDLAKAEMIVAVGPRPSSTELAGLLKGNLPSAVVILRNGPEEMDKLVESVSGGVMLRGRRRSVILPSAGTPLHLYDVL